MGRPALNRIKSSWARFRSNFWRSLALDVLLIVAVMYAIHAWQTRHLPVDQEAPETVLALLDGTGKRSAISRGEAGIVYFFAPWCFYCKNSIGNLGSLVSDGKVAWATVIALDFADAGEVSEFVDETGISLPVLMGNKATANDWSISAFPTYYVIDADGRISSRAVGYSTLLGMRYRYSRALAW